MTPKFPAVLPALVLALVSLLGLFAVRLAPGGSGQAVAAFFPPQLESEIALQRVAAAGGRIVRFGGLPSSVIARSDNPDFVRALYREGAFLVTNGDGVWGCGGPAVLRQPGPPAWTQTHS